jgi:hypothetical protein
MRILTERAATLLPAYFISIITRDSSAAPTTSSSVIPEEIY